MQGRLSVLRPASLPISLPARLRTHALVFVAFASLLVGCSGTSGCWRPAPVFTEQHVPLADIEGIWISRSEVMALPTEGPAWEALRDAARKNTRWPNLSDQEDMTNVYVLAKALVYVRTREPMYREQVIAACMDAMGTERRGNALSLGRELAAYVIAADLVGLPEAEDQRFRAWLRATLSVELDGRSLRSTQEDRPNNWGNHAAASRVAVALYLKDSAEVQRAARVFKGYLGDRAAYAGFRFGALDWQSDPRHPVGINPLGATLAGHDVDGVLPDDQRRCCKRFTWPAPHENYVYEGLQGALATAVMLDRAGYDVWNWQDRALLRAFRWLHEINAFPAVGDDTWQPHVVNFYYGTNFPAQLPARAGKNVGYTDWTHGPGRVRPGQSR